MSLSLALNNAVSSLQLNQQQLSVLSANMANVNTEGYTRKVVQQSAVYVQGVPNGVKIDDIVRKVDNYVQRATLSQGSVNASAQVVNDYYNQLQILLGSPGAENSLDEYTTRFFTSMQQMADQPDRTSYRSNMMSAANVLAKEVSGLAGDLEDLRFQADQDINGAIGEINTGLKKLYDLNAAIKRTAGAAQSTAGLLDERDKILKTLSENLDITVFYANDGAVNVTSTSGVALVDSRLHQLQYTAVTSVDHMINNGRISPINVLSYDVSGTISGDPVVLVPGGEKGSVTNTLTGGKMQGLLELRDKLVPDILNQLDMLASRLRDSVNALHNNGTGWPPATTLTGTRSVVASTEYAWSGSVRIAVLSADGQPVDSGYGDETYTGIRPLTLNFENLRSDSSNGQFSMQTLVDEINDHFGPPTKKVVLGALNNIELVADTKQLPSGSPSLFDFDFDVENISAGDGQLFISNVTVRDAGGATLPNALTRDVPSIALDGTNTYTTYAGENYVDISLLSVQGLTVGQTVYLGPPSITDANGIGAGALSGYVTISEINPNGIRIVTNQSANSSGIVGDPAPGSLKTAYQTVEAGEKTRTFNNGELQVSFGSAASDYYDITVDAAVRKEDGSIATSQITYRIYNQQDNLYNDRYQAISATGSAVMELPTTTQPSLRAILVDDKGVELPKADGQYIDREPSYLKLVGGSADYVIALDEMDSKQLGNPATNAQATNWGFSHFFGLNNFFAANNPVDGGETVKNSAINLSVEQRILDNPNLISAGKLVLSQQPTGATAKPVYTYVRHAGDNSAAQAMAALADTPVQFDAAGGMPSTSLSLQGYTSEMLGYMAALSSAAQDTADNAQLLYDGFAQRQAAISAVNLDQELANTIVFQNAYAASARVVSVIDEMFKSLVDSV